MDEPQLRSRKAVTSTTRKVYAKLPRPSAMPTLLRSSRSTWPERKRFRGTISFAPLAFAWKPLTITVPDPGFTASRNFDGPLTVVRRHSGQRSRAAGAPRRRHHPRVSGQARWSRTCSSSCPGSRPGETLSLKVRSRRAGERELKWKIGSRQEVSYELKDLDQVTQRAACPSCCLAQG